MDMADFHEFDRDLGPNLDLADRYDVVVVGARVAGAATAMLLARRGFSVLAIDRGHYGADILSTHSLARAGVLQLSRWGLLNRVRAAGTPVTRTVVFDYDGDRVAFDLPPRGDVDGLYNPRRTVLDPLLVEAAIESGADVRHGVSMIDLTRDAEGRVNGVVLDAGAGGFTVGARYVVGADGVRSRVARQVDAAVLRRDSASIANAYAYFEGLPDDTIVNYYSPERVVGVIPTNDAAVVWIGMHPERFAAHGRRDIAEAHAATVAKVPALDGQVRAGRRVSGFRVFAGLPGLLRQPWGAGWVLVGDAGYYKDPVSAHGITDALIGAELAADAMTRGLDGDDEVAAFTTMQAMRDGMAAEMMPHVDAAAVLPDDVGLVKSAFKGISAALRSEWDLVESTFGALQPA